MPAHHASVPHASVPTNFEPSALGQLSAYSNKQGKAPGKYKLFCVEHNFHSFPCVLFQKSLNPATCNVLCHTVPVMPKRSQPCQCAGLSNSSGLFPELYVLTHCAHAPFPGQTNERPVTWCPWLFCSSPTLLYVSLRNCPHLHRSLSHGCNLELKTSIICKRNHSLLAWQAVEITSKTAPSAFLENPQNLRHYSVQKPNCDKPT